MYLNGLEYISGYYRSGGKYACLDSHGYTKCPHNPKMCVKSNLLNRDEVSCSTFFNKSLRYGGLNLCSNIPSSNVCNPYDKIPKINGGFIEIRDCGKAGKCYASSKELCQVSYALEDRVDPAIEKNELKDEEYFDVEAKKNDGAQNSADPETKKSEGTQKHAISKKDYFNTKYPDGAETYNRDKYGLRDKTPIELGLCIEIPQGTCVAEDGYSEDTGFASWSSVKLGEDSIGTCQQGKEPKDPKTELKRRCVADPDKQSFRLEPLYRKERNKPTTYPTNIKCVNP